MIKVVDKILDFKNAIHTTKEIKDFQSEIIETKNARLMYLFLYFVNNCDKNLLADKIFDTKDYKYIHFLIRTY